MNTAPKLTMRPYRSDDDFWRMRAFLREIFPLNNRFERYWSVPRLDYWRWHLIPTCETTPMEQMTFLWETADGKLAAILHATDPGEAFHHIHPDFRSFDLESRMYAVAEEHLSGVDAAGRRRLLTLADEGDHLRVEVLEARGYVQRDVTVHHWMRDLDGPLPEAPASDGYTIRSMGDAREYESRAWASWRAFHADEPDDGFGGGDWFANLQSAPLYRRDLDIVAEAPNGEIAAFATIFYEDVNRSAVCVLVGTAAEHWRRGLGKAVLTEGFRRLQSVGCTRVFANGYDAPANALYKSALGSGYRSNSWYKILD